MTTPYQILTNVVIPYGTFTNAAAILIGCGIGMLLGDRFTPAIKRTTFLSLGLCIAVIGMSMALQTSNPLYLVSSVLIGGILGEVLNIEGSIEASADGLKKLLKSKNSSFSEGFIAASVIFCIGSMAVMGPLEEGLTGERNIILTKSLLDFFSSIALGATFGTGVYFSALPILIIQGSFTLFASSIKPFMTESLQTELTAVGGVLILGIACNLLEIQQIKVSNMLPALLVVVVIVSIASSFASGGSLFL